METSTIERTVHDGLSSDFNLGQVKQWDILTASFERDGVTHNRKELVISTDPVTTIMYSSDKGIVKNIYKVRPDKNGKAILALAKLINVDRYEPQNTSTYLARLEEAGLN